MGDFNNFLFFYFFFIFFGGGGGQENECFCGIFLGGHPKTGLGLGVISMHFKVFLKVNVQNGDIFGG